MIKPFEVHTHSFVRGTRAGGHYERGKWRTGTFGHSHEGGNSGHEHPDTGPACYVIDKDDWYRSTGLPGGGRKKFTTQPSGEQMPLMARAQDSFELIICDPLPSKGQPGYIGEGPGIALPMRLMKSFDLRCIVKDGRR